jgi:flagellar motor switch protein FliM
MSDQTEKPVNVVRRYDLAAERGPARVDADADLASTIELINSRFCRGLRAAMLQHLHRAVDVSCAGVERTAHRLLLERLQPPCFLALGRLRPLPGAMLAAFEGQLVLTIVESRFGGDGRFPVTLDKRELSPFEQKSMRRVMQTTFAELGFALQPAGQIEPDIVRLETDPRFAGFAAPDDTVVVSTFMVTIDRGQGRLLIALPASVLRQLHERVTQQDAGAAARAAARWSDALCAGVALAPLALTAELTQLDISVADLMTLRPGDVFAIERPESITVKAEGVMLFRGRWGRHGRRVAIQIDERLSPSPITSSKTAEPSDDEATDED